MRTLGLLLATLATWIPLSVAFASNTVKIPAGPFKMGSLDQAHGGLGLSDEYPIHDVVLDDYSIDLYPVTNAKYAECVQAKLCPAPAYPGSATRPSYFANPAYANYPVIYVHWEDASAYCQFVHQVLPTEAQWEKAARGTDGRIYPWGNTIDSTYANYGNPSGDTMEVGHFQKNVSPYGIHDMAGNVREWVRDWYSNTYYQSSPEYNPYLEFPVSLFAQDKVTRGGSYLNNANGIRASARDDLKIGPSAVYPDVGFRCAQE